MWLFGKQRRSGNATRHSSRRSLKRRNQLSRSGGFLERLEDRRLLAITATFLGNTLTFLSDGTVLDNELTITATADDSTTVSFTSSTDMINVVGAPPAALDTITVNLLAGNDSLTVIGTAGPNSMAVNGLTMLFGAVTYAFPDVENLTVDGMAGTDTI